MFDKVVYRVIVSSMCVAIVSMSGAIVIRMAEWLQDDIRKRKNTSIKKKAEGACNG